MNDDSNPYEEAYYREKKSRELAENLLEDKSRELYNQYQKVNDTLSTLKKTQLSLIQAEKMASLGQLSAGVAHEINNPLSYCLNNIELLSQYSKVFTQHNEYIDINLLDTNKKKQDYQVFKSKLDFDYIMDDLPQLTSETLTGIQRISEIVSGLKKVTRPNLPDKSYESICEILQDSIKIVANNSKNNVQFITHFSSHAKILCNVGEIHQVIINILINAVYACQENHQDDSGIIHIRCTNQLIKNDENVKISISDNGPGISMENQKNIFDPFFTTKPTGDGTGLGLSISHGIIQAHEGSINVISTPQKLGSTFEILLPIHNH